jgi:D-alanyl-D-alanine carboxypeptidase/D-alanyl-D-alanine-endopeptidase (penicillin-binding protein 4)
MQSMLFPVRFKLGLRRFAAFALLGLLPLFAFNAHAGSGALAKKIDPYFLQKDAPRAEWGIQVVDLKTGERLYDYNGTRRMTPASVVKLITTATALDQLGSQFTFSTQLMLPNQNWRETGVIQGDVVLRGGGDPSFMSTDGKGGQEVFERWAATLKKMGLREIQGRIVADDTLYVDEPLPPGWLEEDLNSSFAAEPSALTVRKGTVAWRIPSRKKNPDAPIRLRFYPETGYLSYSVRKDREARYILVGRKLGSNEVLVRTPTRKVGLQAMSGEMTVHNPSGYAAAWLKDALRDAGIRVQGEAVDADTLEGYQASTGAEVWTHYSWPLARLVRETNKRSINLFAENFLLQLGVSGDQAGSRQRGLARVQQFLAQAGVDPKQALLFDGSGLSIDNRLSADALMQLLRYMHRHPEAEAFRKSMAIAGRDGTLRWRFGETELEGRVLGKTGTMQGVRTVAGYIDTPGGRSLAYVLFSNKVRSSRSVRNFQDRLLRAIVRAADGA